MGTTTPLPSDLVDIEITGPVKTLIDVQFMSSNEILKPMGSGLSDGNQTYLLGNLKPGKITMIVTYCADPKQVTLPFGQ